MFSALLDMELYIYLQPVLFVCLWQAGQQWNGPVFCACGHGRLVLAAALPGAGGRGHGRLHGAGHGGPGHGQEGGTAVLHDHHRPRLPAAAGPAQL